MDLIHGIDWQGMGTMALRIMAILLCLVVHEVCHGLAAYKLGDPTAKMNRRLSLNPLHHLDVFGLLMMITVGFGWAKAVPVDPRYFKKPKQGMAFTALAGPVSNFLLAFLAILVSWLIYSFAPYHEALNVVFTFLLYSVAPLSIGLGLFNLLPFPPLDGSKVVAMFLPDRLYDRWMQYERIGILVLLVLSFADFGTNWIGGAIVNIYSGMLNLFY